MTVLTKGVVFVPKRRRELVEIVSSLNSVEIDVIGIRSNVFSLVLPHNLGGVPFPV